MKNKNPTKKEEKEFDCNNCDGKVKKSFLGGWSHIFATGCVKPAVSLKDWRKYQNEK